MECSFSLEHYHEILRIAIDSGYKFQGFHQPFNEKEYTIFLRHDIDIALEELIDIAALESELGVNSTYFILINSPIYNPLSEDSLQILYEIHRMGHWIGLHIDPVMFTHSRIDEVESYVIDFIKVYGSVIPLVPVVSFHRPGKDVLGKDFESFVSSYSPRFFEKVKYISDSRGVWREGCPCQSLKERKYKALQILVHPIWWNKSEKEVLFDRSNLLLEKRYKASIDYLLESVEPIGKLLKGKENQQ